MTACGYLHVCLPVNYSVYLSACIFVCLYICVLVKLSACMSACMYICLYLYNCTSVCSYVICPDSLLSQMSRELTYEANYLDDCRTMSERHHHMMTHIYTHTTPTFHKHPLTHSHSHSLTPTYPLKYTHSHKHTHTHTDTLITCVFTYIIIYVCTCIDISCFNDNCPQLSLRTSEWFWSLCIGANSNASRRDIWPLEEVIFR